MKRKHLPLVIMLSAGAITSILTFILDYQIKDMLLAVLIVLVIFYMLGSILKWVLDLFERQNREAALREGEVIEKENNPDAESEEDAAKVSPEQEKTGE